MQHTPMTLTAATNTLNLHIARQLREQGWCVTPDFLSAEIVASLRIRALAAWQAGSFRHAGVGRGESFEVKPEVRNDQVMWLDQDNYSQDFMPYFHALESLRVTLNRELFLGLFDYEAHLALYPPGSYYKKHLDQFRGIGLRTVTATFYLNADWQPEHGGQLRLYTDSTEKHYLDILPVAGTLVTFLSAEYLHEVLPANRERLSITGWFRRRET